MSPENKNIFFNSLFSQNDEFFKKLIDKKEKIEIFTNILNQFKDMIVLDNIVYINNLKELFNKNESNGPILKVLNHIHLNNTLEIKENKKEKFFKI